MPDRKKVDLNRTDTEKETGIVDPYAEAIRRAGRRRARGMTVTELIAKLDEAEPRVEVFEQIGPDAYHGPAGTVILGPELPADE